MIKIIYYHNEKTDKNFEKSIDESYREVCKLLPGLPKTINIYFSDFGIIPESGIGGFAYSPDTITVSIDPKFKDKNKQIRDIKPTIFHEAFHVLQNFTGTTGPFSALDNVIYEGMATVFEREHCGVWQPYGDYRNVPEKNLELWFKKLEHISNKDFEEKYRDWKFYHPKIKERWIVYKVGTWITDKVLDKHKLTILELSKKKSDEILSLLID